MGKDFHGERLSWERLSRERLSWERLSWERLSWERLSWERLSWERLSWERLSWERLSWERLSWERLSWDPVFELVLKLADALRKYLDYLEAKKLKLGGEDMAQTTVAQTTVAQTTESLTNYYSQVLPPIKIIKSTIATRYKTLHEAFLMWEPYNPIFINEYSPCDRRRRYEYVDDGNNSTMISATFNGWVKQVGEEKRSELRKNKKKHPKWKRWKDDKSSLEVCNKRKRIKFKTDIVEERFEELK